MHSLVKSEVITFKLRETLDQGKNMLYRISVGCEIGVITSTALGFLVAIAA